MHLIITRHGETIENLNGTLQGHNPGQLSGLGIEQAKKVARRLRDEKIDFVYSSDLARASDTAREILKYHPDMPARFIEDLRERSLGDMQGKPNAEFDWEDSSEIFNDIHFQPEGGEKLGDVYVRAQHFYQRLLREHINDTVLVVAHNVIARLLLCVITDQPAENLPNVEKLKNTSITAVKIDKDKSYDIQLFNCINHLD